MLTSRKRILKFLLSVFYLFTTHVASAANVSFDLYLEDQEIVNVHIIEEQALTDYRFIAVDQESVYFANLRTNSLQKLCDFEPDTFGPLESHNRDVNTFIRKLQYYDGWLFYLLSGSIKALNFEDCMAADGKRIRSLELFEAAEKDQLKLTSIGRVATGFICDFSLQSQVMTILHCDGQMFGYVQEKKSGHNLQFTLEVQNRVVAPASIGSSPNLKIFHQEPVLKLEYHDENFVVFGRFGLENAIFEDVYALEVEPKTLSVVKKHKAGCDLATLGLIPVGGYDHEQDFKALFADYGFIKQLAFFNGECRNYSNRKFFDHMGMAARNVWPFHSVFEAGFVFNGDLFHLPTERKIELGLSSSAAENCKSSNKALDMRLETNTFQRFVKKLGIERPKTFEGIFLCDGRFYSNGRTSLHIRSGLQ